MIRPMLYRLTTFSQGFLAIMGRPRGGEWLEDDIAGLKCEGIQIIVSLLQQDEERELELSDEQELCTQHAIEFISSPIRDREVPESVEQTLELTRYLHEQLVMGKGVAIHCRAGIGRSALIAACILLQAGSHPKQALESIAAHRHVPVPDTDEQREWVMEVYRKHFQTK